MECLKRKVLLIRNRWLVGLLAGESGRSERWADGQGCINHNNNYEQPHKVLPKLCQYGVCLILVQCSHWGFIWRGCVAACDPASGRLHVPRNPSKRQIEYYYIVGVPARAELLRSEWILQITRRLQTYSQAASYFFSPPPPLLLSGITILIVH